jgi:hypothetical protein
MNDALLDDLISQADPVGPIGPELSNALAAMGKAIPMNSNAISRATLNEKRRRAAVAMTFVAVLGVGTAAAAAGGLFARTGEQSPGGEMGTGEVLRMDADDLPAVLAEIGADVPLPPGIELTELTQYYAANDPTFQAENGIRASIEFSAACEWTSYWLTSQAADDQRAMTAAESGLQSVLAMPDISASDGGGTMENWRVIANAVNEGDPTVVDGPFFANNCDGPPDRTR